MREVHRSALVPYTAGELYALVADIESYPEFLPWCTGARVNSERGDVVEASLEISIAGFEQRFVTRNRMIPVERIQLDLVAGPFKCLQGYWQFSVLSEQASKVSLDLEFELSNTAADLILGSRFSALLGSMVTAFVERAASVYGSR